MYGRSDGEGAVYICMVAIIVAWEDEIVACAHVASNGHKQMREHKAKSE
jgi:hypothetical protein